MSHPSLTRAEEERLEMLAEECAEVILEVMKIKRHGFESYHPDDAARVTNRENLRKELGDIAAVVWAMLQENDIKGGPRLDPHSRVARDTWIKKTRWTNHQNYEALLNRPAQL